mmetsp:Transcript_81796/g.147712  ORF Transcript_81796/g.147712 Transcript_81796/m.147712 type:complete len:343 (+) Transcript_81796:78-1106(+)
MASGQVKFSVSLPSRDTFDVEVSSSGTANELRQAIELQHETPAACILKVFQGGQLISDEVLISELDPLQPVFAVIARDTDAKKLLKGAGTHTGYQYLLENAPADPEDNKTRLLGPMPSILCVLEEMSGQVTEVDQLRKGQLPETLEFTGGKGVLLVPSLDATPLLKAAGAGSFDRVTVSVEVNSDAYNRGLGVVLEASKLVKGSAEQPERRNYEYNGFVSDDDDDDSDSQTCKNYIKFHPGMGGGQLRVEGPGGWLNQNIGFTPVAWTESGQKFHTLHLVLGANGDNLMRIEGTNAGEVFEMPWSNQLTDGQYLPAVHAWLDLGEEDPVVIGEINMRVHCTE